MIEVQTARTYPIAAAGGASRLFGDLCAGSDAARSFFSTVHWGQSWQQRPAVPAHWPELVELIRAQNPGPETAAAVEAMAQGAGTVLTGQQVGLFGGPLYTPLKAATALARAREATAAGKPHVGIFWLATDDHDFAEIDHVVFPAGRDLVKLKYAPQTQLPAARPVGGIQIDESIGALLDQAWGLLGDSFAMDALSENYKPGRTFAEAFGGFYRQAFAAEGLLMVDAAGREFRRLGAPVLRAAIERADELHAALEERNRLLTAAGYHTQVVVGGQSSLLFLIGENSGEKSGARVALKRLAPTAAEPQGLWQVERQFVSTDELLGILEAEPERISPSALLRPVFQDFLFSTSLIVGGPAELAYFAQNAVLYERILGRQTQPASRFSATLIEPAIADLLAKHGLEPEQVFALTEDALAQQLAERAMPCEGRKRIKTAGQALEAELEAVVGWLGERDEGLGRSAATAASKMRYQMNRMRRLAANYELHKEAALGRAARTLVTALHPEGTLQERVHGAAYYFARYGVELAGTLCQQAAQDAVPGHMAIWL